MGVIFFISGYELPPSQACWAMSISSLVVLIISNSLRLAPIEFKYAKYALKNEPVTKCRTQDTITPTEVEIAKCNVKPDPIDRV